MGQCNSCGKNKDIESEFKSEKIKDGGLNLKKKFGMVQSFAMSLTSRGLTNKKINRANKQLRVLSCFGNQHVGGELPPCEHLQSSEAGEGKYFCGDCGCGDKRGTWLMSDGNEYSKLDYPKLSCPLKMPGFSNYKMSDPDESKDPVSRKYYTENINYKELEKLPVTNPEMSEEQKESMEKARQTMMFHRQEEIRKKREEMKEISQTDS
ncbi:hypothetical protein CL614_07030 [archaeon]|nr:hypothetical protein [archaeon]